VAIEFVLIDAQPRDVLQAKYDMSIVRGAPAASKPSTNP
jgi:hypothetical protein